MRLRSHFNPYNIKEPSETPNWSNIFDLTKPIDLEIGFSTGKWLIDYALKFPNRNIIGLETRKKFIDLVKSKIGKYHIANAYVLQANVNTSLPILFKNIKFSRVFLLFPDPWYKKKHIKRRVINPVFLQDLSNYLMDNSKLFIATDKEFLAESMINDLEKSGIFFNIRGENIYAREIINDLKTDIEIFQEKQENLIYRLIYQKKS